AAAALDVAITAQGTTKAQTVSATQAVATALTKGRRSLNVLSSQVVTALAGNAPLLKEWANVKRISPKPPASPPAASLSSVAPAAPTVPLTPTPEVTAAA
ncbi:MAG TPA: hypothetical protein VMH39_13525, partial [Gemmatimonadaceae bacterium]|nr:hypothetical protein [Gemmatimonadaceae bacterium]